MSISNNIERLNLTVSPDIWILTIPEMKELSGRSSILQFCQNRPNISLSSADNQPKTVNNQPNITDNQPNIEQSKVNKSKVNKSKEDITVSKDTVCRTDVQHIADKWNELEAYGIKQISRINSDSKRYTSLIARIKQYSVNDVLTAIEKIKHSSFLCGNNNRGWTITFDWFVKPSNFPKVLEGNYDNNPRPCNNNSTSGNESLDAFRNRMQRWEQDG